MSLAHATGTIEQVNFRFKVQNVSKLEGGIFSPEITIQGIPWKVRVTKQTFEETQWLGVLLHCVRQDIMTSWEHAAFATFKLISFNADVQTVEFSSPPDIFDNVEIGRGTAFLIKWDNLMDIEKGYVKNDAIVLNIGIEAAAVPSEMDEITSILLEFDESDLEPSWLTFQIYISNIKHLMVVRSKVIEIQNHPFRVTVFNDKGSLGLSLQSVWKSNESCKILLRAQLLSLYEGKTIRRAREKVMQSFGVLGILNIVSWSNLFLPENGFIKEGIIGIRVNIKSFDPDDLTNDAKPAQMECGEDAKLDEVGLA